MVYRRYNLISMRMLLLVLALWVCGALYAQTGGAGQGITPSRTLSGEAVMKALAAAYPDHISQATYRNGDWAVLLRGEWFYYAQGRLLPEELRSRVAEYDPQPFYIYPRELPPWREPGPEESERLANSTKQRQEHPPKRSLHFYDALWRAHNRNESYERLKTIRFLGHSVLIHYSIMEELALVEERIRREAQKDNQVRQWINNISSIATWNWRNIAQTQSRSYHAYGAALDLLSADYRKAATYWLWVAENNPRWWTVPYSRRLHPPGKVIKAFEDYGFIWGGKWMLYDTMHFEYRPEILILSDMRILTN
jgi:hypothetical protein